MQIQAGYYSGNINRDVSFPNVGKKETAAHLFPFLNEDRVHLFTEGVDELNTWLEKQDNNNAEISYWLPLYMSSEAQDNFKTWV